MGPRAYTSPDLGKKETERPPPHAPQSGGLGFFFYIYFYILSVFPSFFQD